MSKAEIPRAALAPPDREELDAVRLYAKRAMDSIGDGSLAHDPARLAIAMAARQEMVCRANLALIESRLVKEPDDEKVLAARAFYRHRMIAALRDQGRPWEALEYADTVEENIALEKAFKALERDDDDFDCPDGCQDDVAAMEGQPRLLTRWSKVKADIPRAKGNDVELVTLWRCSKCEDLNASKTVPPSRVGWERAAARAAPGTGDADIFPVINDANQ